MLVDPVFLRRDRPATVANIARNAIGAGTDRAARWDAAREMSWELLDRRVPAGSRVALIGAGNGDDLPLARLAARAARLDLFDLDRAALRRAVNRCPAGLRRRLRARRLDITAGAADRLVRTLRSGGRSATLRNASRSLAAVPPGAIGTGDYDVMIGDLFYSQLLYPALRDSGLPNDRVHVVLAEHGPRLTDGVVGRMQASVGPDGVVIHLHDAVGWWEGHEQPVSVGDILGQDDCQRALALISSCRRPVGTDPRESAVRLGAELLETVLWEWEFAAGTSYLVCATVTRGGREPCSTTAM